MAGGLARGCGGTPAGMGPPAAFAVAVALVATGLGLAVRAETPLGQPAPFRVPEASAPGGSPPTPGGQGRVFAADHYGGYLIWALYPRARPYIDTRLVLRTADEYAEFLGLLDHPERWAAFAARTGFDHVVLPTAFPDRYLGLIQHLYGSPDWRLIYTDGSEVLFARADSPAASHAGRPGIPPGHRRNPRSNWSAATPASPRWRPPPGCTWRACSWRWASRPRRCTCWQRRPARDDQAALLRARCLLVQGRTDDAAALVAEACWRARPTWSPATRCRRSSRSAGAGPPTRCRRCAGPCSWIPTTPRPGRCWTAWKRHRRRRPPEPARGLYSADRMENEAATLVGQTIAGKYAVEHLLAIGGMGAVYRARQIALDRLVALKILHRDLASDRQYVERFRTEAQAASRLDHPHSVRMIDFGEDGDGLLYIAMEYAEGRNLAVVIGQDTPLAEPRIVQLMSQVLSALAVAHEMGVVHRDLKPENIIVTRVTGRRRRAGRGGQGVRLRHRQGGAATDRRGQRRAAAVHAAGGADGHARIHVARAGAGRGDDRQQRHLLGGRGAVSPDHRSGAVHGRQPGGHGAEARDRPAGAPLRSTAG